MLFSTPEFFVFFAVYFALHLAVPSRYRLFLVIVGSTIFYAWWKLEYVWIPYALMSIAYGGVQWMEQATDARSRRLRTITTIAVLFVPLLVFKYTDFIYRDVLGPVLGWKEKLLQLSLPLGISFITFTLTTYIVDVYRGKFPSGQRPATLLAYVLFFPHLIAGPILRPHELIPQLERPRRRAIWPLAALAIFTVGLVKKLVFADQIGIAVDSAYAAEQVSAAAALLAIYGFSAQIYCDFSGYTDMAIGLALMLGVRLPGNFERPYLAASPAEFWRRWHITLSTWLRDYVYIPLGGNRTGRWRTYFNLIITMALGGLWHGANWTFLAWGLLHGVGVAATHAARRLIGSEMMHRRWRWFGIIATFHFVTFAWVFFRAPNFGKAREILTAPFVGPWSNAGDVVSIYAFPIVLIIALCAMHPFDYQRRIKAVALQLRREFTWALIVLGWLLAVTVSQGSSAKFVYFDF